METHRRGHIPRPYPAVKVPSGMHIRPRDFREILGFEVVSMTGGLLAGIMLALLIGKLELLPGLFILLPGFLEMRGNISGSLAARLSSGLFLKAVEPRWSMSQSYLRGNVLASFSLAIVVSIFLGLLAWMAMFVFTGASYLQIIAVSLIAGVLANFIEIPLTVSAVFFLFRRGHDPNNVMGPVTTTVGDIVSVAALAVAMVIV